MKLPADKKARGKPLLLAVLRPWGRNTFIKQSAQLLDKQIEQGWDVLLIPAHFAEDSGIIKQVTAEMKRQPLCINKCLTAGQFIALTAYADIVFSMRMHALICAMAVGTPMLALSYNPKVDAFMQQIGMDRFCMQLDSFRSKTAIALLEEAGNLPPQFIEALGIRRAELNALASRPAQISMAEF